MDYITIREATEQDLSAIKGVMAELIEAVGDTGGFDVNTALENCRILLKNADSHILVAEADGFDNSPYKISQQNWNGKKIVLTTTNGTRALLAVQDGFRVAIGSFRNIDAVCRYVKGFDRPIALVPVGDRGNPMLEDELCAEAMLNRLRGESVDWRSIQEAILEKVKMDVGKMGETYRKDALLSTSPNETDIIPVLHDGLVLRRSALRKLLTR